MAGIPGIFIFVIGLAMTIYSRIVYMQTPEPWLNVFFYLGIIFIFWGIVKMVLSPSKRQKDVQTFQEEKQNTKKATVCPRCNARNFHYARFCMMCGYRFQ